MTYASALTALADPTRRKLLDRVRKRPYAVGELARALGVTQPAVSQHLRVLERARLVRKRAEGRHRFYSIDHGGLAEVRAYVDRFWTDALGAFAGSFQTTPEPR